MPKVLRIAVPAAAALMVLGLIALVSLTNPAKADSSQLILEAPVDVTFS